MSTESRYRSLKRTGYAQFDVAVDGKYACTVHVALKKDDRSGDITLSPIRYRDAVLDRAYEMMPVLEGVDTDTISFEHTYTVLPHNDIIPTNNENKTSKKGSSSVPEPADE